MTAIHRPAPVNQFYRLEYNEVTKLYEKTTRWNHTHILNGQRVNFDKVLCMGGAGSVALDAHTGGRIRTSPGRIHDLQSDMSGGIGVNDVADAWYRGWGETLLTPDYQSWGDVIAALRARRHVICGVVYNVMPDAWQAQLPGNFDHALNLDDIRSNGDLLVFDSLRTKPLWMPQSAVRAAAQSLALRQRGTAERLFVAYTAIRPLLTTPKSYRVVLPDEAYFVYDVTGYRSGSGGGKITGRHSERRWQGENVPCTPVPTGLTTGTGAITSRKLVRITKGVLVGKYVSAAYARLA
jgi:hypothetical protein